MPEVSILIPTYNSGEFIEETIQSALSQTFRDFEIVLVDNASSDNTWDVICHYRDEYDNIKAFRNDKNIGPIKNWRRCIDEASGKYGKILWSDDLIEPVFLEKTVPVMNANADIAFVYTPAIIFDDIEQNKIFYTYLSKSGTYPAKDFIKGILYDRDFPNSPACALFRLSDLKKNLMLTIPNRFNSDASQHAIGNDLLLFLLTVKDYKFFSFINQPLARFRIHPNSITIGSQKKKLVLNYDIAKAYFVDNYLICHKQIKKFNSILWLHNLFYNTCPSVDRMYFRNKFFNKDWFFLVANIFNPRVYIKRLLRKFS
ncbi:glycosyltransferase family 2 protein [Desulfobacterota bacterium M19]